MVCSGWVCNCTFTTIAVHRKVRLVIHSLIPFGLKLLTATTLLKLSYRDAAALLIGPNNDNTHPEGKVLGFCKDSIEAINAIRYMRALVEPA
jgi:hypothetical protein